MTTTSPVMVPIKDIVLSPGSSILMTGLTWAQFEQLLDDAGDNRRHRLTYYKGTLEITMPSDTHEFITRMVDALISILCEEMGLNLKTLGSTTLKAQQLDSGPEADNEYYIQNEPLIRGKKIDLAQDPPPDLVVEIDITHSNLNKKEMYRQMGVPEFWSYSGKTQQLTFHVLEDDYVEHDTSRTFPLMAPNTLEAFIERCDQEGELAAKRWFRSWVRSQLS